MASTCDNDDYDDRDDSPAGGRRLVLRRTVTSSGSIVAPSDASFTPSGAFRSQRLLRLMMIACEEDAPYGPADRTGSMFIDLIADAIARRYAEEGEEGGARADARRPTAPAPGCGGGREEDGGREAATAEIGDGGGPKSSTTDLTLTIYRAKLQDYPRSRSEWDAYDGIVLPGSTSDAYGEEGWIKRLRHVIQTQIYAEGRKCLAVCFGHQVYALSFGSSSSGRCSAKYDAAAYGDDTMDATCASYHDKKSLGCEGGGGETRIGREQGLVAPCPSGHHLGRRGFRPTPEGRALLFESETPFPSQAAPLWRHDGGGVAGGGVGDHYNGGGRDKCDDVQLLYTHGDMVISLPPCAVVLGRNDAVPIQAAAYFASAAEAERFRKVVAATAATSASAACSEGALICQGTQMRKETFPAPRAITFQAHPEFLSTGGMRTFSQIADMFKDIGTLPPEELDGWKADAEKNWMELREDSLGVVISVGRWFDWF